MSMTMTNSMTNSGTKFKSMEIYGKPLTKLSWENHFQLTRLPLTPNLLALHFKSMEIIDEPCPNAIDITDPKDKSLENTMMAERSSKKNK